MKMLTIMGLVLASAPALAVSPAPRWTAAGTGAGGGTIEIDRASLTWRPVQRAWWRIGYSPAKADGTARERHLELIDCRSGTSAVIETVSLDAGGRVIDSQRDGEDLAFQRMSAPTPETAGETVLEQACRLRPPPPPPPKKRR
jgi:hypothetical protein